MNMFKGKVHDFIGSDIDQLRKRVERLECDHPWDRQEFDMTPGNTPWAVQHCGICGKRVDLTRCQYNYIREEQLTTWNLKTEHELVDHIGIQ